MKQTNHTWSFSTIGGVKRVNIESGADLLNLEKLDPKLWTALSCPVNGLEIDKKTLQLIDLDNDGQIRVPEIINAVNWITSILKDPNDLLKQSDAFSLSSINSQTDLGRTLLESAKVILKNLGNEKQTPFIQKLDMELAAIEKGGYDHFMLKEIFEQPATIFDCLRGRLLHEQQQIIMAGVDNHLEALTKASRIMIVACGTSWHAGLVAEYMIEELCRIPVEVEYASEFRYRNPVIHPGDVIIAISQSGETADTLVALESAKEKGAFIFGVVNAVAVMSLEDIAPAALQQHITWGVLLMALAVFGSGRWAADTWLRLPAR